MGREGTNPAAARRSDHIFGARDVCDRCGISREAATHLGWSCTPSRGSKETAPKKRGAQVFGSKDVCERCGSSRPAIEHFGWRCGARAPRGRATPPYPRTDEIRKRIEAAVIEEARTGVLAAKLRGVIHDAVAKTEQSEAARTQLETLLIRGCVEGHAEGLRAVPLLLDAIVAAANTAGIGAQIRPVVEVAQAYFLDEADLIPDHLGLLGLCDDAYLVLTLIQRISLLYQQLSGQPLLAVALTLYIDGLRGLLSVREVAVLNGKAEAALAHLEATLLALSRQPVTLPVAFHAQPRKPTIDFKREMIRDQIRHDLAKGGIFL